MFALHTIPTKKTPNVRSPERGSKERLEPTQDLRLQQQVHTFNSHTKGHMLIYCNTQTTLSITRKINLEKGETIAHLPCDFGTHPRSGAATAYVANATE